MNLKSQLSIVFGSPCSHQNNAMSWSAVKACALTDHQDISGRLLLKTDKTTGSKAVSLVRSSEEEKRGNNKNL